MDKCLLKDQKKTKETDLLVNKMDDLNVKTCNVIFAP